MDASRENDRKPLVVGYRTVKKKKKRRSINENARRVRNSISVSIAGDRGDRGKSGGLPSIGLREGKRGNTKRIINSRSCIHAPTVITNYRLTQLVVLFTYTHTRARLFLLFIRSSIYATGTFVYGIL